MKNILVTGGFGFIGTTLIELLLNEDGNVHVVDDLSTSPVVLDYFLDNLKSKDRLSYSLCTIQEYFNKGLI